MEHYGEGWKVGLNKKPPVSTDKITVDKNGKIIKKDKGGKRVK